MSSSEISLTPSVEDNVEVGKPEILASPHVSEGPGQIAKSPVPSIYADDRGDIHRLRIGGKRLNLLYSKKQVMRSGYLHPHTTHDFVISGKVEVWTLTSTKTIKTIYGPHEYFAIPPYVPHILHFLEDTSLLEWWSGDDSSFQCWVYHPYRKIIDIQNALVEQGVGRHHRLVLEDDLMSRSSVGRYESSSAVSKGGGGRGGGSGNGRVFLWTVGGMLVGVVLGTLLSGGGSSSNSDNGPSERVSSFSK